MDAPEFVGIVLHAGGIPEPDNLVASHSRLRIDRVGLQPVELEVRFGAGDEERPRQDKAIKALEIEITPIHHIEGSRLQDQFVQDLHIGLFSLGNRDKNRDGAARIQQRVQLDGSLGSAEACPRKQIQTKVNGGGIQGVDRLLKGGGDGIILIEIAGAADEHLSQVKVDAPVAFPVGIGQGAVGNVPADAEVIELILARAQAGFNVPEAFPKGELAKSHAEKLIPAGEAFDFIIALITADAAAELLGVNEVGDLGKNHFSGMHPGAWPKSYWEETPESHPLNLKSLTPLHAARNPVNKGSNRNPLRSYPDGSDVRTPSEAPNHS